MADLNQQQAQGLSNIGGITSALIRQLTGNRLNTEGSALGNVLSGGRQDLSAQQSKTQRDELLQRFLLNQQSQQAGFSEARNVASTLDQRRVEAVSTANQRRSRALSLANTQDRFDQIVNRFKDLQDTQKKSDIALKSKQDFAVFMGQLDQAAEGRSLSAEQRKSLIAASEKTLGLDKGSMTMEDVIQNQDLIRQNQELQTQNKASDLKSRPELDQKFTGSGGTIFNPSSGITTTVPALAGSGGALSGLLGGGDIDPSIAALLGSGGGGQQGVTQNIPGVGNISPFTPQAPVVPVAPTASQTPSQFPQAALKQLALNEVGRTLTGSFPPPLNAPPAPLTPAAPQVLGAPDPSVSQLGLIVNKLLKSFTQNTQGIGKAAKSF